MKRIGMLLVSTFLLSGCNLIHSERAFDCSIDQSFNEISRDRNGLFTFPTAATTARVYLIDNTLHIMKFDGGDYTGYTMAKNEQQRQVESIKDFKVMINKGDLYYDDGRAIEVFSPEQNIVGFYYVDPSTGKADSIQYLTECQRRETELELHSHKDHNHSHDDDHNS